MFRRRTKKGTGDNDQVMNAIGKWSGWQRKLVEPWISRAGGLPTGQDGRAARWRCHHEEGLGTVWNHNPGNDIKAQMHLKSEGRRRAVVYEECMIPADRFPECCCSLAETVSQEGGVAYRGRRQMEVEGSGSGRRWTRRGSLQTSVILRLTGRENKKWRMQVIEIFRL